MAHCARVNRGAHVEFQHLPGALRHSEPNAVAATFGAGCAVAIPASCSSNMWSDCRRVRCASSSATHSISGYRSPLMLGFGANHGASSKVMIAGFATLTAIMLYNAGLGVYHAGIEWKFWPGPADCSGALNNFGGAGGLMDQLQTASAWCAATRQRGGCSGCRCRAGTCWSRWRSRAGRLGRLWRLRPPAALTHGIPKTVTTTKGRARVHPASPALSWPSRLRSCFQLNAAVDDVYRCAM